MVFPEGEAQDSTCFPDHLTDTCPGDPLYIAKSSVGTPPTSVGQNRSADGRNEQPGNPHAYPIGKRNEKATLADRSRIPLW